MNAGRMRERVAVQSIATVTNGRLGRTGTATTVATVWAAITPALAPEGLVAEQVAAVISHVVTLRYQRALAALGPRWRLLWGSRVLEVQSVENVGGRGQAWRLACREVQV